MVYLFLKSYTLIVSTFIGGSSIIFDVFLLPFLQFLHHIEKYWSFCIFTDRLVLFLKFTHMF